MILVVLGILFVLTILAWAIDEVDLGIPLYCYAIFRIGWRWFLSDSGQNSQRHR